MVMVMVKERDTYKPRSGYHKRLNHNLNYTADRAAAT